MMPDELADKAQGTSEDAQSTQSVGLYGKSEEAGRCFLHVRLTDDQSARFEVGRDVFDRVRVGAYVDIPATLTAAQSGMKIEIRF